jgi:hypothetical protein
MVNKCVLYGCSATSDQLKGFSVHSFPKEPHIRRQWVRFVQTTRADFVAPKAKSSAVICSQHFTVDSYEVRRSAAQQDSCYQQK